VRKSEAAPNQAAAGKDILDFFRRRTGRNVEILGYFAKQQITHTSAHNVGFISGFLQIPDNIGCIRAQFIKVDAMLSFRDGFEVIDIGLLPDTQSLHQRSTRGA
jgi:hypothetical protein